MTKAVLSLLLIVTTPLVAATITVNSVSDISGADTACTLREAIGSANSNTAQGGCASGAAGPDTINFNISGTGPHTITVLSTALPNINEKIVINGYSQPGAVMNSAAAGWNGSLQIVISGASLDHNSGTDGLTIANSASGSTIRGLVINQWSGAGMVIQGSNNIIQGNFIGTNATGTAGAGNGRGSCCIGPPPWSGIAIEPPAGVASNNNLIGGNNPADRNVIGANTGGGIQFQVFNTGASADGNVISGNYIGTNASGTVPSAPANTLSNTGVAISIQNTDNTLVGGTTGTSPGVACTGACNLLSGNSGAINISSASSGTTRVQGNFIGTDVNGSVAMPTYFPQPPHGSFNTGSAITISGSPPDNQVNGTVIIGGTTPAERNLISGHTGNGVDVQNGIDSPASIFIQGNYIGTNAAGNAAIPNSQGVHIQNTQNVFVGWTVPGSGNLISGNNNNGVNFEGGYRAIIQSNLIGTQANGVSALRNKFNGVDVRSSGFHGADDNVIGAHTPGAPGGNVIAFNGSMAFNGAGVLVSGMRNRILSNSIYSNTGTNASRGIDLGGDGLTANDSCDTDGEFGSNGLQNFPVLTSATTYGGNIRIQGSLNSTAGTYFTLEFFSNTPASNNQGRTYLGTTAVTTGGSPGCSASFNVIFPKLVPAGNYVTATATSPNGDTSEFSAPVLIVQGFTETGDLNADGNTDLVWRHYGSGANSIWVMSGTAWLGEFASFQQVPNLNWVIEGVGDFDRNGSQDLIWRNYSNGQNSIWLMNGTQWSGTFVLLPTVPDLNWYIDAVGNFNGDSSIDLVWRNYSTGQGSVWFLNGTTWPGVFQSLPTVAVEWKIESAGDFDLDGDTDLLWRNYSTGANSIWLMNPNAIWLGAFNSLPAVGDPTWTMEASGDYDNDGDLDIFWRNYTTGGNSIWRLIGASWNGVSADYPPPVEDILWRIEDY